MKSLRWGCLLCAAVSGVVLFFGLFLFWFGYPRGADNEIAFPETGTWVCEDLGITLYRDRGFAIIKIDGQEIRCDCWHERGDARIYIDCDERSNTRYEYGYRFFSGTFLCLDGDVFTIRDQESEIIYIFRKVTDSVYSS